MDNPITIELGHIARELNLPDEKVSRTVELLDEGNTVPFITRFRKDQTGGLDEEKIRQIQDRVSKARLLAERKDKILRSIEAKQLLTPEVAQQIQRAPTMKRLEDLYLPYKPKKQTRATVARSRGLEPLAARILNDVDLTQSADELAQEFVSAENEMPDTDTVLVGVGHIIAEQIAERANLRGKLRKAMRQYGRLRSVRVEQESAPLEETTADKPSSDDKTPAAAETATEPAQPAAASGQTDETAVVVSDDAVGTESSARQSPSDDPTPADANSSEATSSEATSSEATSSEATSSEATSSEATSSEATSSEATSSEATSSEATSSEATSSEAAPSEETTPLAATTSEPEAASALEPAAAAEPTVETDPAASSAATPTGEVVTAAGDQPPAENAATESAGTEPTAADAASGAAAAAAESKPGAAGGGSNKAELAKKAALSKKTLTRQQKKKKKQEKLQNAFSDYFDFSEPLPKIPPHRVLAINRGERARILRVKIDVDTEALIKLAIEQVVPDGHPRAEFIKNCARDAMQRLLIPSLEREVRRELTDKAEQHAVEVFIRNLRQLLLQPPVHGRRTLAIDPGFRSGCKLVAIDEFGNVLGHDVIHIVGNEQRKTRARQKLSQIVKKYLVTLIAIGNGTACRETEQLVANVLATDMDGVEFVIVNEAGASVYSTSQLGREELPQFDATLRSAVSIGRRLLDPLSELVKINPANIGVGMYQHDVKAKHLRESLAAVVESCVNYVGVDVNSASPALLSYVSGLNQLTARRLYEYRQQHGTFKNRDEFRKVPGFGDATFVQAAGFLKIVDGDNPLDATWIHPESYEVAQRVLDTVGARVEDLVARQTPESETKSTSPTAETVAAETVAAETTSTETTGAETTSAETTSAETTSAEITSAETTSTETTSTETTNTETTSAETTAEIASTATVTPTETQLGEAATADAPPIPIAAVTEAAATSQDATESPPAEETLAAPAEESTPSPATSVAEVARESSTSDEEAKSPSVSESTKTAESTTASVVAATRQKLADIDATDLAGTLQIGELSLRDILGSLARPGRDPREDFPGPVFRRGIMKMEDLEPGMELSGTVLNVVDFGAFVDIGLNDSALVHISRLADRYISDPHEVTSVGDVLAVWVLSVDKQRRRVSLTAIKPGTEKPPEQRGRSHKKKEGAKAVRGKQQKRPPHDRKRSVKPKPERRPPKKPKPVKPITQEMEDGSEPMRTFSDLLQFYSKKQDE